MPERFRPRPKREQPKSEQPSKDEMSVGSGDEIPDNPFLPKDWKDIGREPDLTETPPDEPDSDFPDLPDVREDHGIPDLDNLPPEVRKAIIARIIKQRKKNKRPSIGDRKPAGPPPRIEDIQWDQDKQDEHWRKRGFPNRPDYRDGNNQGVEIIDPEQWNV